MGEITPHPKALEPIYSAPAPIGPDLDLRQFDCGKPALNDWLRYRALKSEGQTARTYVICNGRTVRGFYCVNTGAVKHDGSPGAIKRNAPNPIPIMIIGRLAVDQTAQGQGIGSGLLRDALARCLAASKSIGARAVIVHAADQEVVSFYANFGFRVFPSNPLTLYITMDEIAAAL